MTSRPPPQLEETTGVKKEYLLIVAAVSVVAFMTLGGMGSIAKFVAQVVAVAYPGWQSFHAIEAHKLDAYTQWLMYWSLFGAVHLLESVFITVLVYYFPFYYKVRASERALSRHLVASETTDRD